MSSQFDLVNRNLHSFKTKVEHNFKTAFDPVSYIVCLMSRYKITQLLLNNHSAQELSATSIYLNFLTNFLKITKDPLLNVIASACIACLSFIFFFDRKDNPFIQITTSL